MSNANRIAVVEAARRAAYLAEITNTSLSEITASETERGAPIGGALTNLQNLVNTYTPTQVQNYTQYQLQIVPNYFEIETTAPDIGLYLKSKNDQYVWIETDEAHNRALISVGGGATSFYVDAPLSSSGLILSGLKSGDGAVANTPGSLTLLAAGLNSAFYNSFTSGENTANATYTLPTAMPTTSGSILVSTDAGVMSWTMTPAVTSMQLIGANGLTLGHTSAETSPATGGIQFKNSTNTAILTINAGATTTTCNLVLPTGRPTVNGAALVCTTSGIMSWQDTYTLVATSTPITLSIDVAAVFVPVRPMTSSSTGFTYNAGASTTTAVISDPGGGKVLITTAASLTLSVGDIVCISGTTAPATGHIDGIYAVEAPIDNEAKTFTITATFAADQVGGIVIKPATLKATALTVGNYNLRFDITKGADGKTSVVNLMKNLVVQTTATVASANSGTGSVISVVAENDLIYLTANNTTTDDDLTINAADIIITPSV